MKASMKIWVLVLTTLFVLTALLSVNIQAAEDETPAVKIAEKEGLGKFLTDPEGMTLYYFTKDMGKTSACTGFCLEKWPIFYSEVAITPAGCDVSDFDVITREDGKKQTAYKGRLLYYFNGDTQPGDTKGQGVFDSWYVVAP